MSAGRLASSVLLLTLLPTAIFGQSTTTSVPSPTRTPYVNFQIAEPLTLPKSVKTCEVPILRRLFANSYYDPEIVQYTPPTDCGPIGSWAGISLNWTATSNGTQYDRLSGVTLQNVEIWRTSTAEPSVSGIIWTVLKDVTKYTPLFSKPGSVILDLNNIVDPANGLNGEYDVRLTATFYQSDETHPKASTSDVIIPLSTLKQDDSNMFSVPPAGNTTVSLPRNAITVIAEIQASGNGAEEFWFANVPDEYLILLPNETTYGKSSFREVRLLVDGQVAGIVFPFLTLFTGAYVPAMWRPVPAYGAFDLPTYTIDLTPFVPILADGKNHTVSLDVASDEYDHTLNPNWYLSGNLQVILDSSTEPTTGNITSYNVTEYATSSKSAFTITDGYNITVSAAHSLEIEAEIVSGSGKRTHVVWKQDLQFVNSQTYVDYANEQTVLQSTTGSSISIHNNVEVLSDKIDFPLSVEFSFVNETIGSGWTTFLTHEYNRRQLPSPFQPRAETHSYQQANGTYINKANPGYSRMNNGTTINRFSYVDENLNTYQRELSVTNNTILSDREGGTLSSGPWLMTEPPEMAPLDSMAPFRLPGKPRDI